MITWPCIRETSKLSLSPHLLWTNWDFTRSNICTSFNMKSLSHSLHRTSSIASASLSPLSVTFLALPHSLRQGSSTYVCTKELWHTMRFFSLFFSTQFLNVMTSTWKLINTGIFVSMESNGLLRKGSFIPSVDTEPVGKHCVPIWEKKRRDRLDLKN